MPIWSLASVSTEICLTAWPCVVALYITHLRHGLSLILLFQSIGPAFQQLIRATWIDSGLLLLLAGTCQ